MARAPASLLHLVLFLLKADLLDVWSATDAQEENVLEIDQPATEREVTTASLPSSSNYWNAFMLLL